MHPSEYRRMYEAEEHHWWYVGLRELIEAEVRRLGQQRDALRMLDAGCGTGANLQMLARYGTPTGIDLSPDALALCRERALPRLVRGSVNELPFACESFDLVLLADVLYHAWVTDDVALLGEVRRVLRPGGVLLLHSAALECLRGEHDEVVLTRKRYTRGALREVVEQAGLVCEKIGYRNALLVPALYLRRRLRRSAQPRSDVELPAAWLNRALLGVTRLENRLLARGVAFAAGSSLVCVGRKILV